MRGTRLPAPAADRKDSVFPGDSELAGLMRDFDWAATSLGAPQSWSRALKTAVGIMLTSRQPIWIGWGDELIYLYNDPYKSIIGGKHPWALGRPTRVVWREIWNDIAPMLAQAKGGLSGTYVESQLLIMERNGYPEETYYTFSYSPIPDDDGTTGGIFCANTDDTDRMIGERQLKLLRELAAGATEARTWQAACERAMRALATNPFDLPFALIYMLEGDGKTAALVGAAGCDAQHPAAAPRIAMDSPGVWPLRAALAQPGPYLIETLAFERPLPTGAWDRPPQQAVLLPIPASGETGHAGVLVAGLNPYRLFDESYAGFLKLAAGQIAAAIANADAYEQERRRADALLEIDRAKTVFFSNVSHEFRTPLTLMLGPLEDVLAAPEPQISPQSRELVALAHRNGTRLLKLVNALLDFSRIEAGRMQATYREVDLGAFTSDLAAVFRSAIEKAGLRLKIDVVPLAAPAFVDRDMWEKIVFNLLSNAFKFTFEGEIGVTVRPAADGKHAEVIIADTGIGIPADQLPHLFERFRRVEGARGRSHEGSGIGLALVQELVTFHGGSIAVTSEPERGTTFTVTLPLGAAHLPDDRVNANQDQVSTGLRAQAYLDEAMGWLDRELPGGTQPALADDLGSGIPTSGHGELIVLADDNADMRRYISRLLQAAGFRVEALADGEAALQAVRQLRPALVLSDVMMPKMDGYQMLSALRADQDLRTVPVILLSARAGEEAKVEGLRAGADDYLVKPFSAQELLARVTSNIEHARIRDEATAAVRESEQRFRAFVTTTSDVLYRMSPDWRQMWLVEGKDVMADTLEGDAAWLDKYIFPDDRPRVIEAIERAIRNKDVFELEHRVVRADGTPGWVYSRAIPLLDGDDRITEWFGTASDITGRKRQEEHQKMLVNELNHRVKNTLAAVQSMARQTLRNAGSLTEANAVFDGRLIALAKAHDVLTREQWERAGLRDIVTQSIGAYLDAKRESRLRFGGPEIWLQPRAALALSMAFHELATNAVKYGALSNENGRVELEWSIDGDARELNICWIESGGPPVKTPSRKGFGSRLIEQGLPQELGGEVRLRFDAGGVACDIRVPLDDPRRAG